MPRVRVLAAALCTILAVGLAAPDCARAGETLDRMRASGSLRCGAEPRPGLAALVTEQTAAGLFVDLCRAMALAAIGPAARIDFVLLESDRDFDAIRHDPPLDLVFLTGAAIQDQSLAAHLIPGPTVFLETQSIMVPTDSAARSFADLAGTTICVMSGSDSQRALEASFEHAGIGFVRMPFQEDVEMIDAYAVGRCGAVAAEATELGRFRRMEGVNHRHSRLLPQSLAVAPVLAATGTADGTWSALAFWVLHTLMQPTSSDAWHSEAAGALFQPEAMGLRPDWRTAIAPLDSYATMLRRNLGETALALDPGVNAVWPDGLLVPPTGG